MKAFICALITFCIVIGAVLFFTVRIDLISDGLINEAKKLPRDIFGADISAVSELWDKNKAFLNVIVSHAETDKIDDAITMISSDIATGFGTEYRFARESLISLFERLRSSEAVSIDRIF